MNLYVTKDGLVVAHVGKRGAGAMAGMSFFGKLSGAVEDLLKGGKEAIERRERKVSDPEEILRANKDNFLLSTSNIVNVELDTFHVPVRMVLVTQSEKFQLSTLMAAEPLESLLRQVFNDKVSLARRPQ